MPIVTFRFLVGDFVIATSMIFFEELGLKDASAGARGASLALRPRVVGPFASSLFDLAGNGPLKVFAFFGVVGA